MPLSKNQTDKLGDRLRDTDRISDEDLALLQQIRQDHDDAMASVAVALRAIVVDGEPLAPTSRLKTVGTIVDKLRRESVRLSQMQDIAGVRIVVGGTRNGQDRVVEAIAGRFPSSKVQDRRASPSHGYRAVHVMARQGVCWVEIQVRTQLQDFWAQIIEGLGDIFGRQIRYGEPAVLPEGLTGAALEAAPAIVPAALAASPLIDQLESAQARLEVRETFVGWDELEEEVQQQLHEAAETVNEQVKGLREQLEPLVALLGTL